MSKLVTGDIAIGDLTVVQEAALQLGWDCLKDQAVSYFYAEGPMCDVVVSPSAEEKDDHGRPIGKCVGGKYTIGFKQEADGKVKILHDNAMNGTAVFSAESGQTDPTTQRVVGKLKQAIAGVRIARMLRQERASWRVEQRADGAQVVVVKR